MNIVGLYKANGFGNLTPSRTQRQAAVQQITATLRTRLLGHQAVTPATTAKADGAKALSTSATAETGGLGTDMFLRLLMEQIRNQDPLDPMDNTDMLAQLAQFTALEQMNNLNTSFQDLAYQVEFLTGNIDQLNFISAQGMIGRYVEGLNLSGDEVKGIVESVALVGSIVVLTVDGEPLPMTGVMLIGDQAPPESPVEEPVPGDAS
ncbi:MAG TPA: flagellar hook capping FlgD N-terminal domain-containing protein [Candidatus Hydrogenedentes bacterium]|nr:flagellar hook capping FlgD N-terminal domain-containing protein [Candidatus Hydrogenedentota bacterium]